MMVAMLDSDNRESVYTSCGVLINLMADHEKRIQLKRLGGITKSVLDSLLQCLVGNVYLCKANTTIL